MHFEHPVARRIQERAFGGETRDGDLDEVLALEADRLAEPLLRHVRGVGPDLLVVQNAWAIPMHLPLAGALARVVESSELPTLSHEHDYWWERDRFALPRVRSWLDRYFPWDGANVRHLAINSRAKRDLRERRGIDATVVPNVMDFDAEPPSAAHVAEVRERVRSALGLARDQRLILQPTRVVDRKGIELSIELLARLGDRRNVLVISHPSGDEGNDTLARLRALATSLGVDLRYEAARFAPRTTKDRFALADAFLAADFVSFPSRYEGFGNALLEAVLYRRPAVVNRYPVYAEDIAPAGMRFVELDGRVDDDAVEAVANLLRDGETCRAMTEHNVRVARHHFGFDTLRERLRGPLSELGFAP